MLPDPEKLRAVRDYPGPDKKTDIRAFLGLVRYYRQFLPNFSSVAAVLSDLTKKVGPERVLWTESCEKSFRELKRLLVQAPVLKGVDSTTSFMLHTEASDRGIGAVLSQAGADGEEHLVAYASRKLEPWEVSYAVIERECLAVVWALKYFHPYLFGQEFTIETDHQPLTWLDRIKSSNARMTRWALAVQPYPFTLKYRKGTWNGKADGLSRGPLPSVMDARVTKIPAIILRGEGCGSHRLTPIRRTVPSRADSLFCVVITYFRFVSVYIILLHAGSVFDLVVCVFGVGQLAQ